MEYLKVYLHSTELNMFQHYCKIVIQVSEPANTLLKIHLSLSVQLHSGEILSIVVEGGQNFHHFLCMKLLKESLSSSHKEAHRCTGWLGNQHKCSCLLFKIESQGKEKVVVLHCCAFLGILATSPVCHSSSFTI